MSQRLAERFDRSLPANQRKLEAAEALAQLAEEAGLSLIELAIAFALDYPAVTAAIIGPRTMEQLESQLPAAEVVLDALLDRIDQIRAATTLACAEHAGPVVGASLRVVAARLPDRQRQGETIAFQITEVQKALKGVDYPASKAQLADHAAGNDADRELVDALRGMDMDSFDGPNAVMKALKGSLTGSND